MSISNTAQALAWIVVPDPASLHTKKGQLNVSTINRGRPRFYSSPELTVEIPLALKGLVLRLARYFGKDAQSWLNLQLSFDLKIVEAELMDRIEREVETMAA